MSKLFSIGFIIVCIFLLVVDIWLLAVNTYELRKYYGKENQDGSKQYWYEDEII